MPRLSSLLLFSFLGIGGCIQESRTQNEQTIDKQQEKDSNTNNPAGKQGGNDAGATDGFVDPFGDFIVDGIQSGSENKKSGEGILPGSLPMPSGDPNEVIYLEGDMGFYTSPPQNELQGDVEFYCPGDSFLSGELSDWKASGDRGDRIYQFHCQFLTDGQGVAIRKRSCSLSDEIVDTSLDYSCSDGKFLSGVKSVYNRSAGDRSYRFECCEAVSEFDNKKLIPNSSVLQDGSALEMCQTESMSVNEQLKVIPDFSKLVNINVNDVLSDMDFSCSNAAMLPVGGLVVNFEPIPLSNAILRRVQSSFSSSAQDRRHSFYCCQLQVDTDSE